MYLESRSFLFVKVTFLFVLTLLIVNGSSLYRLVPESLFLFRQ
jgi:hypothetical protein